VLAESKESSDTIIAMKQASDRSRKRVYGDMADAEAFHIAIIGSGVAGLAAARALEQIPGIIVTIYERDKAFHDRRQGFGMTLTNNPTGALAKLGIREKCQEMSCPSSCHYIFDSLGQVLGYYGRYFDPKYHDASSEKSSQGFNLRIPRQELRRMLYEELEQSKVHWGRKLLDYHDAGDKVQLVFHNESSNEKEVVSVDLLVGCDGIRSIVRQLRDEKLYQHHPNPCPLKYLGVSVIIGLSSYEHPLITDRGFYVLNGSHRLFIMPYRQPSASSSRLTMWQLSFAGLTEEEAILLRGRSSAEMLAHAIERVQGWFDPIAEIILHSLLDEIWATPLYDRDPMQASCMSKEAIDHPVVVLGDACHPMSMFKGQGANQAMEDGPLLAKWLAKDALLLKHDRKKLGVRLKCFEREMLARTSTKVLSSREAAGKLHSSAVLEEDFGIEGVEKQHLAQVFTVLKAQHIDATRAAALDGDILAAIQALQS
jgi:2-polyprenyl-6-methoxyphenol hydroxylase-like FAD-dependent oxidoreductase